MTSIISAHSVLANEGNVKHVIECVLNYTVTYAGKQERNQTILIRTHTIVRRKSYESLVG